MKSSKVDTVEPTPVVYPCLMESVETGSVVLFTTAAESAMIGVCVFAGRNNENSIGEYVVTQTPEEFKPYTGEITLKND